MSKSTLSSGSKIIIGLVLLLLILHQDYWQWNRSDLLFGFVPYSLAYHMGLSLVTAIAWMLAVTFAWPKGLDEVDVADGESLSSGGDR